MLCLLQACFICSSRCIGTTAFAVQYHSPAAETKAGIHPPFTLTVIDVGTNMAHQQVAVYIIAWRTKYGTTQAFNQFTFGNDIDDARSTFTIIFGTRTGQYLNAFNIICRNLAQHIFYGRGHQFRRLTIDQYFYITITSQLYITLHVYGYHRYFTQYIGSRGTLVGFIIFYIVVDTIRALFNYFFEIGNGYFFKCS
ncbi:hypothetical protein D3C72_1028850 [compost metagenome]